MKKNYVRPLGVFICLLGPTLLADTIWTGVADSNFGNVANWDMGTPGNNDGVASIGNSNTVSLASNHIGANPYNLTVENGSTLNASADFTATQLYVKAGSTVNLNSGAFTLPKTSPQNNGAGLNINGGGTLSISGGTHQINERSTINGIFRVDGSAATIQMNQIGNGNNAVFDFIFDGGGVSTITGDLGFSWLSIANSSVKVDGSAFSGTGSFTLIDCNNFGAMPDPNDVTVSGLGTEGIDWNLVITDEAGGGPLRDTIVLTIIPEPASIGLLGLGLALTLLFRRRRS